MINFIRFIPGSSANDLHYQVYLLEGVTRWNQARALAAIRQQEPQSLLIYDLRLADKVTALHFMYVTLCTLYICRSML